MRKINFEDITYLNSETLDAVKMSRIKGKGTSVTVTIVWSKKEKATATADCCNGMIDD